MLYLVIYFVFLIKRNQQVSSDRNDITIGEVSSAIKSLKAGKVVGVDDIRPEMLKALKNSGIRWLIRIYSAVWKTGKAPTDWQTDIIISTFKKSDQTECSNYRGITLLSLLGQIAPRIIEQRCRQIIEPQIKGNQCSFRAERSTTNQIFTIQTNKPKVVRVRQTNLLVIHRF